ncbi:hypothetical protein L208DRAFT_1393789 [Tricholoma matsutake]|nr:hypothetical protein L208DRAFT_1393789 [Tricholoma matsutake 945]
MLRLCRQFSCTSRCSRVQRVQPLSRTRQALSTSLGRRYTSSDEPVKQYDKFDRLFASLRHGMDEDELAKTIAALVLSTSSKTKLDKIEMSVPQYTKEFNRNSLFTKVNHYLTHPPEDNFYSLAAQTPSDALAASLEADPPVSSTKAYLDHNPETLLAGNAMEVAEYDPTLPSLVDQLLTHIQTEDTRKALEKLELDDQAEFRSLLLQVVADSGEEDMTVLDSIARFLSYHGAAIQFRRQAKDTEVDIMEEFRALEAANPIEDDEDVEDDDADMDMEMRPSRKPDPMEPLKIRQEVDSSSALQQEDKYDPFPDLMTPDPLLDPRDVLDFPPDKDSPFHNQVTVRNHTSIFTDAAIKSGFDFTDENYEPTRTDETEESDSSRENLPLSEAELHKLYRFPLIRRRITQQTGKGKIHRQFVLMVVGNGDGLVGYGQGKDEDAPRAENKAFAQAVRNMDWVERFEKRTIWTDLNTKLGATQLIMRPRPVGFGLRCNPNLHQVLKAAGIKDISAKVWGSRNPINVIKAAFRVLQAGHAPLAMGDGVGGPGRKLNKGTGLRSKSDVERERGRQLISLRK